MIVFLGGMIMDKLKIGEINDALATLFQNEGNFAIFDDLANFAKTQSANTFKNDSYVDAVLLTRYMFRNTKKSARILTGHGGDVEFLNTLQAAFREMLKRAEENFSCVKVIFLANEIPEFITTAFKRFIDSKILVCRALQNHNSKPIRHFMVCDNDMVRVEEPHNVLCRDSKADEIKAKMYFKNESMASAYASVFDLLWEKSTDK